MWAHARVLSNIRMQIVEQICGKFVWIKVNHMFDLQNHFSFGWSTQILNCSFECPDQLVNDKCYSHGKFYDIGEIVPDNYTKASCSSACECVRKSDEPASFECAENCACDDVDHNCVQQYKDLNSCCGFREICGE